MMIYIDGGFRGDVVSYGMRFEAEQPFEHYGARRVNPSTDANLHEYFALFEAVLVAIEMGFKPTDCHFASDHNGIVSANKEYQSSHRTSFLKSMIRVRKHYDMTKFSQVMTFIAGARFSWVKGHRECYGNRRADHLATAARDIFVATTAKGKRSGQPKPYDDWLKQRFSRGCGKKGQHLHWYAPFTKSIIERDGQVYALCV